MNTDKGGLDERWGVEPTVSHPHSSGFIRVHLWFLPFLLAAAGCSGSTSHWIAELKSPEPANRVQAIRKLQDRKSDAAEIVPALIEALKDDVIEVRRTAAGTLGSFGADARSAVPALTAALKDREPGVRRTAAQALKQIDPDAARKAGVQ
jgi:hypothetical protein